MHLWGTLAGVPDLVVLGRDGQAWLLEVKVPGGYLSPEQRSMHERCVALGVPFAVVRSIEGRAACLCDMGDCNAGVGPMNAPVDTHCDKLTAARNETFRLLQSAAHYCRCAQMHLEAEDDVVTLYDIRAARDYFISAIRAFNPVRRTLHERLGATCETFAVVTDLGSPPDEGTAT